MTIPRVTKFSTHEIFHPRIFSRLLRIGLRESRNLKPRKLILKTRDSFSRKFAPPKITRYTVCKNLMTGYSPKYLSYIFSIFCSHCFSSLPFLLPLSLSLSHWYTTFLEMSLSNFLYFCSLLFLPPLALSCSVCHWHIQCPI